MDLKKQDRNGTLVVTPEVERLDIRVVGEFRVGLREAVGEHARVVLDMAGVEFVDSSGLGALLSLLRALTEKGGSLKLAALGRQVKAMFRLVRMYKVFDIFDSVEEAVAG